jgi:hypothetical protein
MATIVPPRSQIRSEAHKKAIRAEMDSKFDGRIAKARGVKRCALKVTKRVAVALRMAGEPDGLPHGQVLYGRSAVKK